MNKPYFCTLFDSHYLSRGLTMYESLKKNLNDFHLYIFAFDELALKVLLKMNLSNVTIVELSEFEDRELLIAKSNRNRVEYCWTCTPSTVLYCLKKFDLPMCTYLDADLYFYSSPIPILQELVNSNNSILITEHRFSKQYLSYLENGVYNVQFMTFQNDENGLNALLWWRNSCIEWCYSRLENGKFGDQKYLDDWPTRFKGVHVLKNLGGAIGPWNVQQYSFYSKDGETKLIEVITGKEFPVIFYHFHNFKLYNEGFAKALFYKLSADAINLIYRPYLTALVANANRIKLLNSEMSEKGFTPLGEDLNYVYQLIQKEPQDGDNFLIYDKKIFQRALIANNIQIDTFLKKVVRKIRGVYKNLTCLF